MGDSSSPYVSKITERHLGWLAVITALLTILWLVLLVYAAPQAWFAASLDQAVKNALELGWVYFVGYALAAIITIVAMMFFAGIYTYCRSVAPVWSAIALVFVPVYGVLNLTIYMLQITVIPPLLTQFHVNGHDMSTHYVLSLLLHGSTDSVAWILNNLAYSMLGISSIIFGILLGNRNSNLRVAGLLLVLSGIAPIIGMVGIVLGIDPLHHGSLVGGLLFLISLLLLIRLLLFTE